MKGPYTGMRVRITEPTGGGKTRLVDRRQRPAALGGRLRRWSLHRPRISILRRGIRAM